MEYLSPTEYFSIREDVRSLSLECPQGANGKTRSRYLCRATRVHRYRSSCLHVPQTFLPGISRGSATAHRRPALRYPVAQAVSHDLTSDEREAGSMGIEPPATGTGGADLSRMDGSVPRDDVGAGIEGIRSRLLQ